jgi:NAD(P)-dependent dehydrogenase (short-subunit alcohol dehydrogenase family)
VTRSTYFDAMIRDNADPKAFVRALEARSPLNRMAAPMEIATMILWLASDEASFATGAMFTVDGGMSAW